MHLVSFSILMYDQYQQQKALVIDIPDLNQREHQPIRPAWQLQNAAKESNKELDAE